MKWRSIVLILPAVLLSISLNAQLSKKYLWNAGVGLGLAHSFPNFEQDAAWKGSFYPAAASSYGMEKMVGQDLAVGFSIGATAFALVNRSEYGTYVFDFIVPYTSVEVRKYRSVKTRMKSFIGIGFGMQLSYKGVSEENFQNYDVFIKNNDPFIAWIRPEVGLLKRFRKKPGGNKHFPSWELSTFFRFNFQPLGIAEFRASEITTTAPKGDLIGLTFKYWFPIGKKKVARPKPTPTMPEIRDPRHL